MGLETAIIAMKRPLLEMLPSGASILVLAQR